MEFNGNFGGESMKDSEKIIGEYYRKIGIGQDSKNISSGATRCRVLYPK